MAIFPFSDPHSDRKLLVKLCAAQLRAIRGGFDRTASYFSGLVRVVKGRMFDRFELPNDYEDGLCGCGSERVTCEDCNEDYCPECGHECESHLE